MKAMGNCLTHSPMKNKAVEAAEVRSQMKLLTA